MKKNKSTIFINVDSTQLMGVMAFCKERSIDFDEFIEKSLKVNMNRIKDWEKTGIK